MKTFFFLLLLIPFVTIAEDYDDLNFDVKSFEKKTLESNGYFRSNYTYIDLGKSQKHSTLNELNIQSDLDKGLINLHLNMSGHYKNDSILKKSEASLYLNSITQTFGDETKSLELGKKTQRWGKGYSYSSVAFFERPKDTIYPELVREGFWMVEASYTKTLSNSSLKNYTVSLLAIPDIRDNEFLYHENGSVYGAKLYLLLWNIDFDLIAADGIYGIDFSANLLSELEIHGEYGNKNKIESYLVGLRYQTATDLTFIAEYVDTYNEGQFYYLKATQKEPFRLVYSSFYFLYTKNIESSVDKFFVGMTYDFKNGWTFDGSLLHTFQGNGARGILNYYF